MPTQMVICRYYFERLTNTTTNASTDADTADDASLRGGSSGAMPVVCGSQTMFGSTLLL